NRVIACATGTLVTSMVQSSSATTVMLVGFVDAGLMTLTQAIGVVLGANIGTTVTAQLIAFNISNYAWGYCFASFFHPECGNSGVRSFSDSAFCSLA
ncbi:MAG: Na/Pi symporter, partial [Deltaproteobacteria bacterium]|nr:Na/Pi symporter [Deltaproteobacteria bacterium]